MSIDAKRRYAAASFITLLLLSLFWPSPIVSSNRLWWNESLAVDELSFLGREAPSWDVVFWCIAGLLALAIVQSGRFSAGDPRAPLRQLRVTRPRVDRTLIIATACSLLAILFTWFFIDGRSMGWAELARSDEGEAVIRIANRFGGGMNPPLIAIFFFLAGIVYRHVRWVAYSVAMAVAGLSAGAIAHVLKIAVGRTRPELWLGAFHFAGGGAHSFPSGHTVGAFALGGVLLFASPSRFLRVLAIMLATAVGISRVIAFRHWPSDVLASAAIGLLAAWLSTRVVTRVTSESVSVAENSPSSRRWNE